MFFREVDEKNARIADLERRLHEAASLAQQEVLQKAKIDLRMEQECREKLEFSLANLQMTLQNLEAQHSE